MLLTIDTATPTWSSDSSTANSFHHWPSDPRQGHRTSAPDAAPLFEARASTVQRVSTDHSCVVPPLQPIFERTCEKLLRRTPLVVGPGIRTGIPIRVDNPREVGADRIVNAVATVELMGAPAIAIDFGTATSFDCISSAGEFVGGAIYPGVFVSLEALVNRASKLSSVEIVRPPSVIGRNTVHNLQSGMVFGYAGMVDTMVRRMRRNSGRTPASSRRLPRRDDRERDRTIEKVEPFLDLEGLASATPKSDPGPGVA